MTLSVKRTTFILSMILMTFPILLGSFEAQACSCLPPDIAQSYNSSDEVIEARIATKFRSRGRRNRRMHARMHSRGERIYYARVQATYKGCRKPGSLVRISTAKSGAQCGVTGLEPGKTYLLHGDSISRGRLRIGACDYNTEVSNLTQEDRDFLDTRYTCCGTGCECVNSVEVACFVDPCEGATACDEAVECVSNYCGGCRAEFYDPNGSAVCQDAICLSEADCGAGQWCRPLEGSTESACVAYQSEGEYCGGFTPIWAEELCDPELVCTDVPAYIADAPGKCRQSCNGNPDCDEAEYCSTQADVCRGDGACFTDHDCEAGGNDYIRPLCVGYGVCGTDGQCGWECGDASCRDLALPVSFGEFGLCEMILGFGVVDGECTSISGCDSQGQVLHDSMDACEAICGS